MRNQRKGVPMGRRRLAAELVILVHLLPAGAVVAQGDVPLSQQISAEQIGVIARDLTAWREGDVWCYVFEGDARAVQGDRSLSADGMVVWFDEAKARRTGTAELHIYATGRVLLLMGEAVLQRGEVFVRWRTRGGLRFEARRRRRLLMRGGHPLFLRALRYRERMLAAEREARLRRPKIPPPAPSPVQLFPTSPRGFKTHYIPPKPGFPYHITVIRGGVDAVYSDPRRELEIEITADNMVIWRREEPGRSGSAGEVKGRGKGGVNSGSAPSGEGRGQSRPTTGAGDRTDTAPARRGEVEVYAEGNVAVFTAGATLRAQRIYYNLTTGQMLLIKARMETFNEARMVPMVYEAERVRRFGRRILSAEKASFSTCIFGRPHYCVFSRRVTLSERVATDILGRPIRDRGGRVLTRKVITARSNTFRIAGIPFFYYPYVEHDLERPETGLRRVRVRQDDDFGLQVLTEEDLLYFLSPILGEIPPKTDVRLHLDYMSKRGPAVGVDADYSRQRYHGYLRSYFLHDRGLDEGEYEPPTRDRGRFLWRHRHRIDPDTLLIAELSWISDEAFLNEYFEKEFREGKDQETVLYLKRQGEQWVWDLTLKQRINDWQSETDYLPRLALYLLGLPLFDDTATFVSRSEVGLVRLRLGEPEREDLAPVPDAQEASLFRFDSRNELHRPFNWWILRVNPFLQGRLGYFGRRAGHREMVSTVLEDGSVAETHRWGPLRSGTFRYSLAAGFRVSTQFWRVYERVESEFWNVDRLRHIITPSLTYFDLFALNVASDELVPMDEVEQVDKLRVVGLKLRQRLQTHRGAGRKRRVVDWITLDLSTNLYPSADRDNYGEVLDDIEADLRWRITDVLSLVSEADYDTKADELGTFSVGVGLDQAPRYSLFLGQRFINASDSSTTTLNAVFTLSEKWRLDWFVQYDWGVDELLQNRIRLQRDLHDFILYLGLRQDRSRDNTVVFAEIVPKGLPEAALRFR